MQKSKEYDQLLALVKKQVELTEQNILALNKLIEILERKHTSLTITVPKIQVN